MNGEKNVSLIGRPFLDKKAKVLPPFKKTMKKKKKARIGDFEIRPGDSALQKDNIRLYSPDEIEKNVFESYKRGTGSIVLDPLLWIGKKTIPNSKKHIENTVAKTKQGLENINRKGGQILAGKDPNTLRGKLFSSNVKREVGETTAKNGVVKKITTTERTPSLVAPIQNTARISAPFLAAAYVGEKLYPTDKNKGEKVNQATYETKIAEKNEQNIFEKDAINQLDKVASLQKIAQLEQDIEKYAADLERERMEKLAVEEKYKATLEEKEELEKKASFLETELIEKQANYDELRLRTIAQKRSKVAVDLADTLLETGLIKQAEYEKMVDKLMDSDEDMIKMYQKMANDVKMQEESLESLAFLREYRGNENLVTSNYELATSGLSKKGQSIGEAARDLLKR